LCRRTILLAGLGLVYNSVAALLAGRPIRFPGVLQRIAVSSFVNAIQPFRIWFFPFVATGIWWYCSIQYYNPECHPGQGVEKWFSPPNCTAQTRLDLWTFESKHLYAPDYDPEGLLSTLTTAAITVCAGILISYMSLISGTLISTYLVPLHHKHCIAPGCTTHSRLIFYLIFLIVCFILIRPLPALLQLVLPMSKPLWTPPFVLQTTGITLLSWLLASFIDIFPSLPGTKVIEAMGRRSLEVYLAAEILQEFAMYPGKRRGGGSWEQVVRALVHLGIPRAWICLCVSVCWAGLFAGFGWFLDFMGWRMRL